MSKEQGKNSKWVLGLTGGVGSGKSTVSGILQKEYGALVLEADRICQSLMEKGGSAYPALVELFGEGILLPSGEIDRSAMADRIFRNDALRRQVNAILHPATYEAVKKRIARSRKKLIVYEAAIPLEARFPELCRRILYVYASPETRQARLKAGRGYSEEKSRAIIAAQPEEALYYHLADGVVNNDGSYEDCRKSLKALMDAWLKEDRS